MTLVTESTLACAAHTGGACVALSHPSAARGLEMNVKHTPGPWLVVGEMVYALEPHDGRGMMRNRFSALFSRGPETPDAEVGANAARAVACVNACEGIDDPAAALAAARRVVEITVERYAGRGRVTDDEFRTIAREALALLGGAS